MITVMPLLGFGIFVAIIAAIAAWVFFSSSPSDRMRREELRANNLLHGPWAVDVPRRRS